MQQFQRRRERVALVVDEYGATAGLVTVEDVAEELLGTISEEPGPSELEETRPNHWRAPGALPVEDLETIGIEVAEPVRPGACVSAAGNTRWTCASSVRSSPVAGPWSTRR